MKKTCAVMLIVVGVVSVIFGCVMFGMEYGYYENDIEYGGDAYTGIQNAAAQTANNVQDVGKIVKTGFGGVFAIGGLVLIIAGANGMPAQTDGVTYEEWGEDNAAQKTGYKFRDENGNTVSVNM